MSNHSEDLVDREQCSHSHMTWSILEYRLLQNMGVDRLVCGVHTLESRTAGNPTFTAT